MALAHYQGYVENVSTGKALPNAVIRVYSYPANVLQSTFADLSSTPLPTVETDSNGAFAFYIPDGAYDLEYVFNGDVLDRIVNVAIYNPANFIGGSNVDSANVDSFVDAITTSFTAGIKIVRTIGRDTPGDGGGASYVRWAAPMPALVVNQEGYSWFESADGAQWTLIETQIRPEMFGAIGHATNDEGLAIRRMFEAASGKEVLITKTHRYKSLNNSQDIRIYSNTKVQGISALTCGFKRLPNGVGEDLAVPSYGIYWQDAENIEINDIFHDVQRSGLGGALSQRVNGFLPRGQNGRWRVNRCIVNNCTGYAFYAGAVGAGHSADGIFTDCIAYNSQVSFEVTGLDMNVQMIRCQSLQYVTDGGAPVVYECGYHHYSGIAGAYHYQCTHRGVAAAVLTVIVNDGAAHTNVVFEDCDFESTSPTIACAIVRNDYFNTVAHPGNGKRAQATFIGGRVVNLSGPGSDFTFADIEIQDTTFISRTITLSIGLSSICALRGNFDIQCIEPVTTSPATAALAAVIDASAVATRTATGSISATHLNGGPTTAVSGTITLVDDTVFTPALGGAPSGTEAPRRIQTKKGFRVEGPSGATDIINAGSNQYWTSIVLDAIPTGWGTSHADTDFDKVKVLYSLAREGQTGIVYAPVCGIQYYRRPGVTQAEVFFTINATSALPANTRLNYEIWEEA